MAAGSTPTSAREHDAAPADSIDAVRSRLAERIGQHRFELWFGHGTTLGIAGTKLVIAAPNSYVSEWIERHFRQALDEIVRATLGADGAWELAIAADPMPSTQGHARPEPSLAHERGTALGEGALRGTHAGRESSGRPADTHATGAGSADLGADATRRRTGPGGERTPRIASFRRLEDFVIGDSNRLAFAASEQVGDGSADAPGILFIHGDCGVGKTHLIQGLCRRRTERAPRQVVRYVTAEQFTNEYIASVRDGSLENFRKRLRRVDLLAIDDIHFFANKTQTQSEFLHTIDAIDLSGAQVALVSDEHPRHIRRFSQALVSRFLSGMVVKVERPDRSTRIELVRRRARERGLDLTTAAEESVASRCAGSIREIEGTITQLGALIELDGLRGQIGPGTVERLLGSEQALASTSAPVRLGSIVEAVCERLRVTREDLLGSGRHARTVVARGLVAHLARELTTHSYPEIARALGRDTHSAVHTAAKRLGQMVEGNARIGADGEPVREVVDQLRHDLARPARSRGG